MVICPHASVALPQSLHLLDAHPRIEVAYDAIKRRRLLAMARNANSGKRDKGDNSGKVGNVEKRTNRLGKASITKQGNSSNLALGNVRE
jgi:hypothetical protein